MLEAYVGEAAFRQGVRNYMERLQEHGQRRLWAEIDALVPA